MSHRNQIEQIEEYHRGNLSPEEMASFEKELAGNPELNAESEFQADIINGLKEVRKGQLKARLDAIDVSPGWVEFAQQSVLVKSFGGVAIATLIGTGVYMLADKPEKLVEKEELAKVESIVVPERKEIPFEWSLAPVEKVELTIATVSTTSERIEETAAQQKVEELQVSNEPAEEPLNVVAEETKETFSPQFAAPDASVVSDESVLQTSILDEIETSTVEEEVTTPIDVETKITKSSKIQYKYYDGKLFLSGNFKNEPYEIIEINSANGRRIYLLHQKKYYEVKTTDRLSDLPEVRNIKLIQELRLIKANK